MKLHATNSGQASGGLRSRLVKGVALIGASATVLAACSSSPSNTKPTCEDVFNPACFHPSWLAANVNAGGTPKYGGTLKIEGDEPPSALLDPQSEDDTWGFMVERAFTRQLVSYPASTHLVTAESVVPDAAASMPTVSDGGVTYTFTLRSGLMWNTNPPRPVTSEDFARGILRNCDPTLVANPGYYEATIAGYTAFCSAFENSDPSESAAARANFINNAHVPGIKTPNDTTIVFTLTQPAVDFDNMLALPFASAAPVEYLKHLPLTPGNVLYSDGPYEIKTYNVTHELTLDHNPAWTQSSDPIRHQYVNEIDIKLDMIGPDVAEAVQNDLEIHAADLEWDTTVPAEDVTKVTQQGWDPQFGTFPAPGTTQPFVRFNVLSPNNNGALGNVKVRQALEYAINKVAIGEFFGGSLLTQPLNQVIAPGAEGYVPFNDYPTPNNEGDPGKCKALLKAAGYPNGLTLKYMYPTNTPGPIDLFRDVESDLAKCGVMVVAVPVPVRPGFYSPAGIGGSAAELKSGTWDLTETGWGPDWYGPANGRAILPDLFDGRLGVPGGGDFGGYDDLAVDALINRAEGATSLRMAASLWHQADEKVMASAAFIPIQTTLVTLFRSTRVHNAIYSPYSGSYDITQVWLAP